MIRLIKVPFRSYRVSKPRRKDTSFDVEFKQYSKNLDSTIKNYRTEFWKLQTEVENEWIEWYNELITAKRIKQDQHWRESVIKISRHTKNIQDFRQEKDNQWNSYMNWKGKVDAGENEKKSIYIEALNLDSKKWITKDNLQETIREQLIVPHNLDFTEYYQRLREQSYHADAGLIGSNYDYFNNRAETKDRNKLVHPFYVEIKSCIKHLTYSPEIQLQEEYEGLKSRLYNYPDKIQLIRQKYLKIFKASRALDSKPDVYLARAHKQLGLLLKLLGYWDKYITLVKMDDTQISSYAASLDGSNRELEDKFLEEDEGWDNDMKDPNPETSDYFDMEKTTAEEFLENLKSKEAPVEVKFNKFEETDNLGTDADMYGDSFGKSVEPAAVESKATLDQLLDELNRDFSVSDLFDKSQDIPDAKTFKKDESGEVYPEIPRSFNPAISLTSLQEKLSKINEVDLDMQARWKRSECLSMIESLNNLRIQEPHMLLKIFDHNQYDPPTFE